MLKILQDFYKNIGENICVVIVVQLVITHLTKQVKNDHHDKESTLLIINKKS